MRGFRRVGRKIAVVAVGALAALGALVPSSGAIVSGDTDGSGHPQVGALVAEFDGTKDWICSGVLVSPTVFVTAAHCTSYLQSIGAADHDVYVTFDSTFSTGGTFWRGTMHTNPLYNQRTSDPQDIAVVVLDDSPSITPATLPPAGWADAAQASGALHSQAFTAVGYGASARRISGGPPDFAYDGVRRFAGETFSALNNAWLRLGQNPARGNGGGCYGDSGGPNFVGGSTTVVSLTITGDAVCRATNTTYRLDTVGARAFLESYVALP